MPILGGVGAPQAFSSASGGKVYAYNTISEVAAIQVAPANPSRQKIRFHNPGANDLYVAPMFVQTTGSNVALVPTNVALGGSTIVYGNGGTLEISGECQGAWQAFSKTGAGTTNSITVTDSNIS